MSTPKAERVMAAIEEIRQGHMIILVDDEDRENEGDLCFAAEKVTPESVNFMARYGRGLICLTLTEERIEQLQLPMMVRENRAPLGTAFTVSIEAREGVTTGISAEDRAVTISAAMADDAAPEDLVSPGHVFPLKARRGGVLVRTGQTEGSVDIARLAGLKPAGVICEIMNDDGSMARMPQLETFAQEHGLVILSIADLIDYRLKSERLVRVAENGIVKPALFGGDVEFAANVYASEVEDTEYLTLVHGDLKAACDGDEAVLVRVQSMCPVGDVFGIGTCDCEWQLREAMRAIVNEGCGVLVYVHSPSRSSLASSFAGHVLCREPAGKAASRGAFHDFGLGAQVLADLGLCKVRLMSNNPKKISGLRGFGIEVVERVPIEATATHDNVKWLRGQKQEGHLLSVSKRKGKSS